MLSSQVSTDSLGEASLQREDSSLVTLSGLNINSPQSDFSPFVSGNKFFFVSGRSNNLGVQYADVNNKTEITDIYTAEMREPAKIKSVKPLTGVNSKYYEGPFCMNRGNDTIYFTGNDPGSQKLKIFMSRNENGKWTRPAPLPFSADTFSYCHPSLSANGRALYLSSNKTLAGDMDLFVSHLENGSWTTPENLGALVNTASNEVFPFAGSRDVLFFASDRAGGLGGLDLYQVMITGAGRGPQLLYPPMNSAADDFGIWADSSAGTGYISTNRFPRSGDDIYRFSRSIPDFRHAEIPPVRKKFCYSFYEETSLGTQDTANMAFEWRFGDGAAARGLTTRHCYTSPGIYNVELLVVEKVSGEVNSSVVNYQITIPVPEQLLIKSRDTANVGEPLLFDSSGSSLKGYVITGTYWSFGDGYFNSGKVVKHRFRKEGKYVVELWVMATNKETGDSHKFKLPRDITVRNAD